MAQNSASTSFYDDFLYACTIGDRQKVAQLLNLFPDVKANNNMCLDGLRAAARNNHRDVAQILWRFSLDPPLVIECWMTRNKPRAVAYWQLRAPIDPTKTTKTFFFVGLRVMNGTDRNTPLPKLCTWCMRPECACGKEEYVATEKLLTLRAEAFCYEGERNSELYDPKACVETTNEYQSEVFLEEIAKEQKALPLMVSTGLCCRRKATLQPMKSAHYHVYFRVSLGGHCFSVEPNSTDDGNILCFLRAKLNVSDRSERVIPGLRSPCIICHTSTRHKRPRAPASDDGEEEQHETKRRSPFMSESWKALSESGEEGAGPSGAAVAFEQPSGSPPNEVAITKVEAWLRKDFNHKLMRFASGSVDPDQLRSLTDEDLIELVSVLKRFVQSYASASSSPSATSGSGAPPLPLPPSAATNSKGYAKQVRASTVTAEQFFHFNSTWWESISVCIAMNYLLWNTRDIFGFLSRQRAEELLSNSEPGVFLVRPSSEGGFAVSVMTETGAQHIKVTAEALLQEANVGMDVPPLLRLLRNADELTQCQEFFFTGHSVHDQ
eukprot:TRINITY_DN23292_c0_g1_i1.p1 TRINITY_DN23292_c0_g1~~TRINITY_DN23292_c0_g1_i1.p1  ORF type:complete len:596 (-),score=143.88 TRINITY_DN23292_c0_g1_i1:371-2020(-)